MRLLFCGDVVGRSGRDALIPRLPELRRALDLDFVVVNGENAAHGFGINETIAAAILDAGTDVITTGNHAWDRRESLSLYETERRLLRPRNYPPGAPGHGDAVYATRRGRKVLVVNVMGRLFMDAIDDPFRSLEAALRPHRLGATVDAVIVDIHAEATSEKAAVAHVADGRASLVVGTHSHVPTADAQVLPGGTAFQTDAGMCGDYDSVIGMNKAPAIDRFVRKLPGERLSPAQGEGTLCGVFVETDDATGLARRVAPVRLGGRLAAAWPAGEPVPDAVARAAE